MLISFARAGEPQSGAGRDLRPMLIRLIHADSGRLESLGRKYLFRRIRVNCVSVHSLHSRDSCGHGCDPSIVVTGHALVAIHGTEVTNHQSRPTHVPEDVPADTCRRSRRRLPGARHHDFIPIPVRWAARSKPVRLQTAAHIVSCSASSFDYLFGCLDRDASTEMPRPTATSLFWSSSTSMSTMATVSPARR